MGKSYKDSRVFKEMCKNKNFNAKSYKKNKVEKDKKEKIEHAELGYINYEDQLLKKVKKCPYCGSRMHIAKSVDVYSTDIESSNNTSIEETMYYICDDFPVCDSYCKATYNKKTKKYVPISLPATSELRAARIEAHKYLDMAVNSGVFGNVSKAYDHIAYRMNITRVSAHIGHFDLSGCHSVCDIMIEAMAKHPELVKNIIYIYKENEIGTRNYVKSQPKLVKTIKSLKEGVFAYNG